MKKILFILFVLMASVAFGQGVRLKGNIAGFGGAHFVGVPPGYTKLNVRYEFVAMLVDSGLHVPQYNGTPSGVRTGVWVGDGAVAVDTTNHRFYIYSGGAWVRVANYSEIPASYTAGDGLLLTGTEFKVLTKRSITIDNDSVMLVNDSTASPVSYFYGTNVAGRKGWYAQSSIIGADTISTTLIAYVDSLGSDVTGTVGNPAKPYATINAALLATASAAKRIIKVGPGTFASHTHAAYIKANTTIEGSGKPQFDNTITGSTYPLFTLTAPTKLVGGTIFQGTFEVPNVSNIYIRDIGVDVGSAFIGVSSAQEGFLMWADTAGTPGTHTNQSGKVFRNNVILENISVLQKDTASLVHAFDVENCFRPVIKNISTWGGFAGVVSKNVGAEMHDISVSKTNADYYGIIIKQNTYAYSYNTLLDGFYIYNSSGLYLHNEDGSTTGMQNINITNGFIYQPLGVGIYQLGDSLAGINISNVTIINPSSYGMYLPKIARSVISNNIVTAATSTGYLIAGSDVTFSGNKATAGFTYDFNLTGVGVCAPLLAYNNSGMSTGVNRGFIYNGYVFGDGNHGTAQSGNIREATEICGVDTSGGGSLPAIGNQGEILQVSNGAAAWKYDTTTLVTFTAGANFAADTALVTDTTIYGSFKLMGNDTFYVTGVSVVLYSNNAITDTLGIQITYNDTINVIGSHVFAATYAVNNSTTGQDADGDDFTGSNSVAIPPGNWVWLKSPTVVAGRKPYHLSVSIIGYKKRKN